MSRMEPVIKYFDHVWLLSAVWLVGFATLVIPGAQLCTGTPVGDLASSLLPLASSLATFCVLSRQHQTRRQSRARPLVAAA